MNLSTAVPYSQIVLHAQVLQTFDQAALHVAGLSCFNSCVHQSLSKQKKTIRTELIRI